MTPETKAKITRGLKTTEFWVVMLMTVLTSIMVTLQEHADTVLPIELQMKILGGLATAYVICRTALKIANLVATVLRLDRGESLPVPAVPAGVKLPDVPVPQLPVLGVAPGPVVQESPHWKGYVSANSLRAEELAAADERERQESLKALLAKAGQESVAVAPPPVVLSTGVAHPSAATSGRLIPPPVHLDFPPDATPVVATAQKVRGH